MIEDTSDYKVQEQGWSMKINEQCLACLVNQAVKTAKMVIADDVGVKEKSLVCMKNKNSDAILRIQQMEQYMDAVSGALKKSPDAIKEDAELCRKVEILTDYMDSGQWLADYEADERGELPSDLKRGILSQDGLYNLICEIEEREQKR